MSSTLMISLVSLITFKVTWGGVVWASSYDFWEGTIQSIAMIISILLSAWSKYLRISLASFCLFLLHSTCNWLANLAGLIFKNVSRVCNPLTIMLATPGAITLHLGTTPTSPYSWLISLHLFLPISLLFLHNTAAGITTKKKGKWDYNILTLNTL